MVRRFLVYFLILAAVLGLISFSGCTKQALIPTSTSEIIKHYERIKVRVDGTWSRIDYSLSPGDYVLLLAYGKVRAPWWPYGQPPHGSLFMKIGENGELRFAVGQPDNRRFFRATEPGRLEFRVKMPFKNDRAYQRLSGGFKVDIFVFTHLDEENIIQARSAARNNWPTAKTRPYGVCSRTSTSQNSKQLGIKNPYHRIHTKTKSTRYRYEAPEPYCFSIGT
jgi:hypothetical protein